MSEKKFDKYEITSVLATVLIIMGTICAYAGYRVLRAIPLKEVKA